MYRWYLSVTVLLVLLSGLLPAMAGPAFVVDLSDNQLQRALQLHFPMREYTSVARFALHKPQVRLSHEERDIALTIPIDASIPGQPLRRGRVAVNVGVNYLPLSGELYLHGPRMQVFEMSGVEDVQIRQELRAAIETILHNALPLVRIYRVTEQQLNHSLSKSTLKSMAIGDELITVTFGFE
jgi:hypothetical protein